jgi:hypothetical protein
MTNKENEIRYWGTGIGLLGLFVMSLLVIKPSHHILLLCDRNKGICTLEHSSILYNRKENVRLQDIRNARLKMVRLLMYDIEIVKQDGNAISFGMSSSWPFITEYEKRVFEINGFLKKSNSQFLSVSQRGYFQSILMGLFLLGGLFCIYKALKPYIAERLTNKK